jgi:dimethylglycine dehydrogenase
MQTHTRAAVIGGGVVGCSVLYHLTKAGWRDVLLIERDGTHLRLDLARGRRHAHVNGDPNVAKLQQYTIGLYEEIERISGQSCGVHRQRRHPAGRHPRALDWLKMAQARGRYLGMRLATAVGRAKPRRSMPLLDEKHFVGAMFDPIEGHVDPYGVTHAYAKSAQLAGAKSIADPRGGHEARPTAAGMSPPNTGTVTPSMWSTPAVCGRARSAAWSGLELPVLAMEHQYLITEDMPEVAGQPRGRSCPTHRLRGRDLHAPGARRHAAGHLRARRRAVVAAHDAVGFRPELLPPTSTASRRASSVGFKHFPAWPCRHQAHRQRPVHLRARTAIRWSARCGPANYWVACGVMAGFSQGGGVGLALAHWMVDGDPGFDVWAMDVARYGDWATLPTPTPRCARTIPALLASAFRTRSSRRPAAAHHADVRAPAGGERGVRRILRHWNIRCGSRPRAARRRTRVTFRRSNAHAPVGEECRAVREAVGLLEISNYGKFEVTGPAADDWLSSIMANRVPAVGRIALARRC